MLLKTLFFSPTLFRKNLSRFWPLWVLSLVMWLIWVPARIFGGAGSMADAVSVQDFVDQLLVKAASQSYWFGAGLGLVCALAVFSYLFQSRSAITIHAMPFRRNCLFFTNYISGLVMLLGPLLLAVGVTIGVEVFCGCLNLSGVFLWLTAQFLCFLFFYSFGVFCTMLTGNLVACPLFFAGLSALPQGLAEVLGRLCSRFLYGYDGSSGLERAAKWLSPFYNCYYAVGWDSNLISEKPQIYQYYLNGWVPLLIYGVAGLLLMVASALLYQQRHIETAGDVVAFPVLRPIFKYAVAAVGALCLTEALYTFVMPNGSNLSWKASFPIYLLLLLASCFVSYFLAEMVLERTLWVFHGHWKGLSITAALLALLVCAVNWDIVRFETRIPKAQEVTSVSVSGSYVSSSPEVTDEDFIAEVIAAHQAVIDNRTALQAQFQSYQQSYLEYTGSMDYDYDSYEEWFQQHGQDTFTITYTLVDGSILSRSYPLLIDQEQLASDESCPQSLWNSLLFEDSYIEACYSGLGGNVGQLQEISMNTIAQTELGYSDSSVTLSGTDAQTVLAAIQQDLAEGTLSAGALSQENDPEIYDYNTLTVTYTSSVRSDSGLNGLDLFYSDGSTYTYGQTVILTANSVHTLQALTGLGVLDDSHFLVSNLWLYEQDFWDQYVYYASSYSASIGGYIE